MSSSKGKISLKRANITTMFKIWSSLCVKRLFPVKFLKNNVIDCDSAGAYTVK